MQTHSISIWSFLCSHSWELQLYMNKHKAKCGSLIVGTCRCFVQYFNWKYLFLNWKIEDLCSSAEAGIVLNLFLNFEQKWVTWYPSLGPYAESSLVDVFRIVALVDRLVACVGMQKAHYT